MNNFCRMCGAKIPKGAGFCPDCGAKVEKQVDDEDFRKLESQGYIGANEPMVEAHYGRPGNVRRSQSNQTDPGPRVQSYDNPGPNYNNNNYGQSSSSNVERVVAAILALLLGGLGVHKFYMGDTGAGIWYLLFCWTGIPAIIGIVEGIIYLVESDAEFQRRVNKI